MLGMSRQKLRKLWSFKELSVLIALIVLCTLMAIASPVFLKSTNIFNVLRQISVYSILAIGQSMVIIIGGLDLSVGTSMSLASVVVAISWKLGVPDVLLFPIVIGSGMFIGLLNGLIITKLKVNAFIVTLGMQYMCRGAALLLTRGVAQRFTSPLTVLGGGYVGSVPVPVIVLIAVMVLGALFTIKTLPGRTLYAVGSNEQAARVSGIRVNSIKRMAFLIMGALTGLCGLIIAGTLNAADPTTGANYELESIAAAIIGGTALKGGEGTVIGAVIGAAIIGVIKNGFVLLNMSNYLQTFTIGFVIIAAVAIDSLKNRKRAN